MLATLTYLISKSASQVLTFVFNGPLNLTWTSWYPTRLGVFIVCRENGIVLPYLSIQLHSESAAVRLFHGIWHCHQIYLSSSIVTLTSLPLCSNCLFSFFHVLHYRGLWAVL
uniref:Uncharacterized protein n=1 Tax=Cacopsylla melanoneura TaxID=428564 RepID=A0A8D8WGY7_9HEMI